jgi:hypothetical protein
MHAYVSLVVCDVHARIWIFFYDMDFFLLAYACICKSCGV